MTAVFAFLPTGNDVRTLTNAVSAAEVEAEAVPGAYALTENAKTLTAASNASVMMDLGTNFLLRCVLAFL